MLMGSLIFLGLMIILAAALMDMAGKCSQAEEECSIETGEAKECAECYWGKEREDE